MRVNDRLAYGQTQVAAGVFGRITTAMKAAEDQGQIIFLDADARVGDGKPDPGTVSVTRLLRREFDGVVDQIV